MIVSALEDLVVEVLHNWGDDKRGAWSAGSGYRVGGALVLTAAHNVGQGEILIRARHARWPATVLYRGDENQVDLALLEITGTTTQAPRCLYGEVDRSRPKWVENCWAVGFPQFKERRSQPGPLHLSKQVGGQIPTGENLGYDLLTLQVRDSPEAMRDKIRESEWSGMSGAAVFTEDILIGVVIEHHRPEGSASLSVVPITAIERMRDRKAWWDKLGVSPSGLVSLPLPELREDGLYVWTALDADLGFEPSADPGDVDHIETDERVNVTLLHQGGLPNLQLQFGSLGSAFDDWLTTPEQRKRGNERLRVFWLAGAYGPERSKGLLACLARARRQGRVVYDADVDLTLAASTLRRSLSGTGFALPLLIGVDLEEDQPADHCP